MSLRYRNEWLDGAGDGGKSGGRVQRLRRTGLRGWTVKSLGMVVCAAALAVVAPASVQVSSPANGATVGSPVHVVASSTGATGMGIFLDTKKVYGVSGAKIDTNISASAGQHRLVIQAYKSGTVTQYVGSFTVGSATTTSSGSTSGTGSGTTTTTNATVYDEVQQMTGWLTCGACGNSGGTGAVATYDMVRGISVPSLSGSSAKFSISGPYAYKNAYWYYRHLAYSKGIKALTYEFDVWVPAGSENAPQAIEFECQQRLDGYVYNFAWQAEYPSNQWRVFNYAARKWETAGVPLTRFSANQWHHVVAEYHTDSTAHKVYHDALTIDGVRHAVNLVHDASFVNNYTDEFTNAFQLDLNGSATPYSVYADRMKITIQ